MSLNRREALGTLLAPAVVRAAAAPARPNLLFILIDDLRFNALGCTGHPFVKTPNIDRIAREGARFTNAFVTTPLCSPARASFLTGQYVRTHKVTNNGDHGALSHKLETFPKLLRAAGYDTAYVGKWHMGNDDSPRPGFNRWVSFRGQGQYVNPPLNVDGKQLTREGYMTDLLSEYAVEFLKQKRDQPFSLYLAHKAVHGPFTPAPRHAQLYAGRKIERHPNAQDTLEGKPALRQGAAAARGAGPADETILNQLRCVASIDEGVGRILATLEETRQLDNTLVLFTSDNGYFWGDHGLGDKRAAYEEAIRIPMVARYPRRIKAGATIPQLALNIDIAPTMLELGGAPIPAAIQGRSLVPLLSGKARGWRTHFLAEYYMEPRYGRVPTWEAVRSERWKYIHYPEVAGGDELYDLDTDRYELRNRIGDASARPALERLQAELARYRRELG